MTVAEDGDEEEDEDDCMSEEEEFDEDAYINYDDLPTPPPIYFIISGDLSYSNIDVDPQLDDSQLDDAQYENYYECDCGDHYRGRHNFNNDDEYNDYY